MDVAIYAMQGIAGLPSTPFILIISRYWFVIQSLWECYFDATHANIAFDVSKLCSFAHGPGCVCWCVTKLSMSTSNCFPSTRKGKDGVL